MLSKLFFSWHNLAAVAIGAVIGVMGSQAQGVPIGGSLVMYYDAAQVTTSGSSVTKWQNLGSAGATLDALPLATSPTLVSGALNGQPVVRFTTGPAGTTDNTLQTGALGSFLTQPITIVHVGLVTKDFDDTTTLSEQPFYYDGRIADPDRTAYYHASGTTTSLYAGTTASGGTIPIDAYTHWTAIFNGTSSYLNENGSPRFGASNVGTGSIDGLTIGARFAQTNRLNGDIAELLVYNRLLNAAELEILNNHFSAKYDLPVATNLYSGDDNANGDYDFDVFGIANSAAITGFAAGSVTSGTDGKGLTIAELSGLDVGDAVMAGITGAANGLTSADVGVDLTVRWERVWYIDETGDVDVTLTFDFSDGGLNVPANVEDYFLIYRPGVSGVFTQLSLASVVVGDTVSFSVPGALLQDGFYTLGLFTVPEPGTFALVAVGTLGLAWRRRRRHDRGRGGAACRGAAGMAGAVAAVCLIGLVALPARAGTIAQWKFDGDFTDSSANGNDLSTAAGTPTFSGSVAPGGFSTQSLSLDGSSYLVDTTPANFGFTSTYSVAGWVYLDVDGTAGTYRGIFARSPAAGNASDIEIYVQAGSDKVTVAHNRSNGGSFDYMRFTVPPDDTWFHLAVTYDGSTVNTYFNGIAQTFDEGWDGAAQVTPPNPAVAVMFAPISSVSPKIDFGRIDSTFGGEAPYAGLLDEFFVFDYALSLEEINNLISINATEPPFVPEPGAGALLVLGGLGLTARVRRRRRRG